MTPVAMQPLKRWVYYPTTEWTIACERARLQRKGTRFMSLSAKDGVCVCLLRAVLGFACARYCLCLSALGSVRVLPPAFISNIRCVLSNTSVSSTSSHQDERSNYVRNICVLRA